MKNQALRIAAMLTLALLVPFFLIACGDTGEGLTRADVSEIVRSEIANVPAPEPGLTGAQVEQIVQEVLDDIKKPEPEPTSKKTEQMADGKMALAPRRSSPSEYTQYLADGRWEMALAPRRSSPSEYTQYLVKNAIGRYESEGLDATLAYYNTSVLDGSGHVDTDPRADGCCNALCRRTGDYSGDYRRPNPNGYRGVQSVPMEALGRR